MLIAEDEPLVRKALALTIASDDGLELVGEAADAEEAIELAQRTRPDVALLDVKMPAGGGAHAARAILAGWPATRIIAFSAYSERSVALDMMRAGAVSYIVKGSGIEDILDTIRRVAHGESVMSAEIADTVLRELAGRREAQERDAEEHALLTSRIRSTIDDRTFEVVYQPIVELESSRIAGAEALSRFVQEPSGHEPAHWFADAERVELRAGLELAAARVALSGLELLPTGAFVAINFSPDTLPLCPELVAPHADRVVLELSAHAVIDDYAPISDVLEELRGLGVRLAIDDAGAGLAGLRHTAELAPELVKLDVGLIARLETDQRQRAVAIGMIASARELGAEVVAEGLETEQAVNNVLALGVRLGQGFHLARPGPLTPPADRAVWRS